MSAVLLVIAILLFVLEAFVPGRFGVNLGWIGLAFFAGSFLV